MSPGNIYLAEATLDFNFSITNAGDGPSNCIFVDQADSILLGANGCIGCGNWLASIPLADSDVTNLQGIRGASGKEQTISLACKGFLIFPIGYLDSID